MRLFDLIELALSNLRRTKTRTILTTLGVIIGIGALVAMVSFGTGMQKNVSRVFYENDLFTSIIVTPRKIDIDAPLSGNLMAMEGNRTKTAPALNDSIIRVFEQLPGVEQAFAQIRFPVKVRLNGKESRTTLSAVPARMGQYAPYNNLNHGRFFDTDSEKVAIVTPELLDDLKLKLRGDIENLSAADSSRGFRTVYADSLIGQQITVISTVIDVQRMSQNPFGMFMGNSKTPTKDHETTFTIAGIQKKSDAFQGRPMGGRITVPAEAARDIPRLDFSSVWDLLKSKKNGGYSSVYIRTGHVDHVEAVSDSVEALGFGTFAILDQLKEMKKGFLIFDTALGAIGTIALIVAALGIINTMIMSILERTREIGVMKSLGGSEDEIRTIFFLEAGVIGFFGGLFGILLGWLATRVANVVANLYFSRQGLQHIEFFYIPLWLIAGALLFSLAVSLLAGVYPAGRAARVDPVKALRHD